MKGILVAFTFALPILFGCAHSTMNPNYVPQPFALPPFQDPDSILRYTLERSQLKSLIARTAILERVRPLDGETARLHVTAGGKIVFEFTNGMSKTYSVQMGWHILFAPNQVSVISPPIGESDG